MSLPILKVAVAGHTNTGKTSLMRTLTRDVEFGKVSNRPATTREVEGKALLVHGVPLIELYDTPGLEDSIGLLEYLDEIRGNRRVDGIEVVQDFLDSPAASDLFDQEAKVLSWILNSDVVLYVIDGRDRVLGKHRDELEILGLCARPVLPVLNFITSSEAKTGEWRAHLARVNMHAVVEFDTVVLDEQGELRLFEKMRTLLDHFDETLILMIKDLKRQRERLLRVSAELVAELLLDVAAYMVSVPTTKSGQVYQIMGDLKQAVRDREQQCVEELLELYQFRAQDYASEDLPISDGRWGLDLFSPASLKQFGVKAGSGAAAGAMAGLAVDAMVGGVSLGAGAATGAVIGALLNTARVHGRRLADRARGYTELRVDDSTLRLLAVRQLSLVQALLRRGHASQDRIKPDAVAVAGMQDWNKGKLPQALAQAKVNPRWSRLGQKGYLMMESDSDRLAARENLSEVIQSSFRSADFENSALRSNS